MKFAAVLSVLATTVATVNAQVFTIALRVVHTHNTTLCYCSSEFSTNVKACLYKNDCDSDVSTFYNNVDDFCDGDEETSTSSSSATTSDTDGTLGTCVLACQESAASEAGCSGNYNQTSCYCDNSEFALDVKACLYQNCSDYVSVFYNYRSDICDTQNSTEWESSIAATSATAVSTSISTSISVATSAAVTTSAAAAASSSTSTTTAAASSSSNGLSAGAKAGISVGSIVGGLLIIGAIAFAILRRRKAASAAKKDAEAAQPVKEIKEIKNIKDTDMGSMTSDDTAVYHH
ncbi:MAG: hypothetical protein M1834_008934 [Cirrosporium novae-zelandiae]|nr:MAG: hypothetical protein M1834_008934 [Cirrosporium novae-zelandiae]